MATPVTITIPDGQVQRIVDAFCIEYGWRSVELDGPRGAFVKKQIMLYIKRIVRSVEEGKAITVAADNARASVVDVDPA